MTADTEVHLLCNKWRCKDGTILQSRNRHDYVTYVDSNGEFHMLDGGIGGYIRHTGNMEPLCVYSNDPHEKIRDNFEWTSYGVNGDEPAKLNLLKDLTEDHIRAILSTQSQLVSHIKKIFQDELSYRLYLKLKQTFKYDENSVTKLMRFSKDKKTIRTTGSYRKNKKTKEVESIVTGFEKKQLLVHRIIYILFNIFIPHGFVVDHMDGNPCNNLISNLRAVPVLINGRNQKKSSRNKTGKCGISERFTTENNRYWRVGWTEDGKRKEKCFSQLIENSFELACSFRDKKLIELEHYTDRHGK